MSGLFAASKAMQHVYNQLGEEGTTSDILDDLMPFDQFHNVVGYAEKLALEEKYSRAEGDKLTVKVPARTRPHVDVASENGSP